MRIVGSFSQCNDLLVIFILLWAIEFIYRNNLNVMLKWIKNKISGVKK